MAGCGFPVSAAVSRNGGRSKSVVENPLLHSVVSSYGRILKSLDQCHDEWWRLEKNGNCDEQAVKCRPVEEEVVDFNTYEERSEQSHDDEYGGIVEIESSLQLSGDLAVSPIQHMSSQMSDKRKTEGKRSEDSQKTIPYHLSMSTSPKPTFCNFEKVPSDASTEATFVAYTIKDRKEVKGDGASVKGILPPISQLDTSDTSRLNNINRNQKNDRLVVLASDFDSKDRQSLKRCTRNLLLEEVKEEIAIEVEPGSANLRISSNCNLSRVTHVVCGGAEYADIDGSHIVKRTFSYLYAVAAALPLRNISWITDILEQKQIPEHKASYGIAGTVDARQLYAPRRSLDKARGGTSTNELNVLGSGLLKGYVCFVQSNFGSFSKSRKSKRSKSQKNKEILSKEELVALLQMCQSVVIDVDASYNDVCSTSHVESLSWMLSVKTAQKIYLFCSSDVDVVENKVRAVVEKCLCDNDDSPSLQILNSSWLLESISEFEIQPVEGHMFMPVR